MNLNVRASGTWQHTLDIEVPSDEVERRLDDVAKTLARRASLPGFRPGRAPLDLVRQHFASTVEQRFLEEFVPQVTSEAVDQARLTPAVPPLVRNLHFGPGQPLRLEAVVDVRPDIQPKDYRGIPVRRHVRPVEDAAVEQVLDSLRHDAAVFVDLVRPAQRGDVVVVDSIRLDAHGRRLPSTRAKALRLELGSPDLLPDLENGLLASEVGQERTIEVTYPADYRVAELAGRAVRYLVRVRKIQEKKLRDLDDNFAKEVFHLESLDELRSRVRLNLEGEARVREQREVETTLSEELIRRNPFDLPERLTVWTLDRVIREAVGEREVSDQLRRELEERYRPGVERSLKREVLLEAVARQEQLKVGDEEVAVEIDRMAQAEPRQASRIRARYQAAERREALRESLLERRALEWLINAAEVKDEVVRESPLVVPAAR
jgi:trigger factor